MLTDFAKAIEASMHKQRDALKKHFPPAQYTLIIGGMKAAIRAAMKQQNRGAYDVGVWLIETYKSKPKLKEKFTDLKGAIIAAAVYEILEEKADRKIITPRGFTG